jgi:hypothetical protein
MAIAFNCPHCPTRLKAKDSEAGLQIVCSKCGFLCEVPYETDVDPDAKALRKANRKARQKFEFEIGLLNIGLLIHYGAVALHMLTLWLFFAGLSALILARAVPDLRDTVADDVGIYLFGGAVVLAVLGLLVDTAVGICSMKVPYTAPYVILRVWMGLHLLLLGFCIWFPFSDWKFLPAACVFIAELICLGLWIAFILVLPQSMGLIDLRDQIGWALLWLGVSMMLAAFMIFGITTVIALMVQFRDNQFAQLGIIAGTLFACVAVWGAAWNFLADESPIAIALYPIGLLNAIRYLDAVGALRMTIDRRL